MLEKLETIAKQAGDIILNYYDTMEIDINIKSDGSPVTKADLGSEQLIVSQLKNNFSYPIVTEETPIKYNERKKWNKYWLVDPLDGTEDFINKNDEFTVNIALVENYRPILGIVYAPALNLMYTGHINAGSKKNGIPIYNKSKRRNLIAADSRQNSTTETKNFLSLNNISKILKIGSSLKLCSLAEGLIDVYPRFNGTKEWDTAAAHIICKEAGCKILDIKTKKELVYNKESIRNNFFIASRNNLSFL
jgi:3'(2'), 5'-bisphosphate nucleotidase